MKPEQLQLTLTQPGAGRRSPTDPGASLWVAASAGTGKTTVLTNRVLRLMLEGTPAARILCITFTKAAAAEMASRIAGTLKEWATADEETLRASLHKLLDKKRFPSEEQMALARRQFAKVLDVPGGMKIQTIHAFCQSLLRRFPLEAQVAPHFEVLDERTAAELLEATRHAVLLQARAAGGDRLTAALGVAARHVGEIEFEDLVGQIVAKRGRIEAALAAHGRTAGVVATLRRQLGLAAGETPLSILEAGCADAAFDVAALRKAAAALVAAGGKDGETGALIARWLATPASRAVSFDAYRGVFLTDKHEVRRRHCAVALTRAHPALARTLEAEAQRLVALRERYNAATVAEATEALLTLGEAVLARYRQEKAARSQLDFDDLIQMTRDLLRRSGVAEWVLFKLDGGIDHILVDEAQDTNLDQWAVIEPLAAEFFAGEGARDAQRTIFAVGDTKQSIFMFQGADPAAFHKMRERFADRVRAAHDRIWDEVPLELSFRSTAPVLEAVDAVFARPEASDGLGATAPIRHIPDRIGEAGMVELWPVAEPREVPTPAPWQPPVDRQAGDSPRGRLASVIAKRIAAMIQVKEPLQSQGRPVRPGDVMVLVRRRNAFVDELVRALKKLDVAVAGVDRMLLTDQIAVMDLMALGRFLLLPDDDLNLAALLRSPLVDLDEDALFALAYGREGKLWPALRARAAEREDFGRAHAYLSDLLRLADVLPVYELYAHVLGTLRGREAMLRRLGPEAADPIDELMSLALAFERTHAPSLQRFLHWVETRAVEVKRELEQASASGEGQVRIMTVHGAKGLEAPIVFLPDTCEIPRFYPRLLWHRPGNAAELPLWLPRVEHDCALSLAARTAVTGAEMEEHRRLLYVAMTRARDRLYMCGYRGKQNLRAGCWYLLIQQGLADLGESFGFDSQPDLPEGAGWTGAGRRHASAQTKQPKGMAPAAAAGATEAAPAWLHAAPPAEPDPPRPLAPSRPSMEEPPVRSPLGPDEGLRFRRGLIIHRLLQSLPDLPMARRRQVAAAFLARSSHGLTDAQQAEMLEETLRVLAEPGFAALFGPGSRAEVPVVGEVRGVDGRVQVVSGQIDRLIVADDEILVLDYKTNRPPPLTEAEVSPLYFRQMAAYRSALARIYPGRPIRCALLWTDGPRLMPLGTERLDAYQL